MATADPVEHGVHGYFSFFRVLGVSVHGPKPRVISDAKSVTYRVADVGGDEGNRRRQMFARSYTVYYGCSGIDRCPDNHSRLLYCTDQTITRISSRGPCLSSSKGNHLGSRTAFLLGPGRLAAVTSWIR